jgi:chaperonin GroES
MSMRTIRPIKDRVLVRQDPAKEMTNGGLYLPDATRELNVDVGTVLAAGPDVKSVTVGDRVMFTRRPASHLGEVSEEWQDLLMLRDEDMNGVLGSDA